MSSVAIVPIVRSLGAIMADAVLEEKHEDEFVITDHPVEVGALVSDHVYKLPSRLTLNYLWSLSGNQNKAKDPNFLRTIYQQILQLGVNRIPFQVQTGKRTYQNMVVQRIGVDTDNWNENVLNVRVECREVQIATTQVVNIPAMANQLFPQKTFPPINQGPVNLIPGTNFNSAAAPPAP